MGKNIGENAKSLVNVPCEGVYCNGVSKGERCKRFGVYEYQGRRFCQTHLVAAQKKARLERAKR